MVLFTRWKRRFVNAKRLSRSTKTQWPVASSLMLKKEEIKIYLQNEDITSETYKKRLDYLENLIKKTKYEWKKDYWQKKIDDLKCVKEIKADDNSIKYKKEITKFYYKAKASYKSIVFAQLASGLWSNRLLHALKGSFEDLRAKQDN